MAHSWIQIQITPVHVVADPEVSNEPVVYIGDDDLAEAKECAQYGCERCDEPLNAESFNSPCGADALTTNQG